MEFRVAVEAKEVYPLGKLGDVVLVATESHTLIG